MTWKKTLVANATSLQGRNHGWKVEGPRFGSQQWGACARPKAQLGVECGRGSPPPAVRVRRYHPQKIFDNSDAKSCILVTTCCEISCFLKTTAKKLGDQYIVGPLNLKVGDQSPPVPTVVAPMHSCRKYGKVMISQWCMTIKSFDMACCHLWMLRLDHEYNL